MKKLFALFITLLLFSCSTEEDEKNSVDPLIGVWEGEIIDTELEEVYTVTLTASTEFVKQGIRLFPMATSTATSTAMAPEITYRGECEYVDTPSGIDLRYEVQEFTWENLGDDFDSQIQTYEFVEYSECGALLLEDDKRGYTNTLIYNSDFTEFNIDFDGEVDETTYYKVVD
tara:strand:+ start:83 stop:598 length:516 start_codon:yes stop_codon:yes gene_type:complete